MWDWREREVDLERGGREGGSEREREGIRLTNYGGCMKSWSCGHSQVGGSGWSWPSCGGSWLEVLVTVTSIDSQHLPMTSQTGQ